MLKRPPRSTSASVLNLGWGEVSRMQLPGESFDGLGTVGCRLGAGGRVHERL